MILYGTSLSPYVRKILVALAEKGVEAEHNPCFFHSPDAAFQSASPLGKIPAIDDGGFKLADSSAILFYIEANHPTPALLPTEAKARGRAIWFDKFGDTELFPVLITPFFNRVVKPKMMGQPCDDAAIDKALTVDLPKLYDYLETQVDGPYLVGNAFSIADISIVTGFHNLKLAGEEVDAGRWPKLAAYVAATLERPSFVKAVSASTGG
ncbi:glutathione S-transferase [Methylobacterium sp. Leaf399]|uniref:glutathione S-transferase family protein n=1 Tax=unclassified Methylobacterium TaxID=2615210 RepID=UPI0006F98478|nr:MULTISPECIES: glutathione S-transferase family protein [unclassified Methylobacterium]KQP55038.1 glutathione S-transferase [Methylobacterium sp. Leaf108]KQT09067.1 glutathione S-transferase [Methylobacterium sp. Leaf399]